MQVSKGTGQAMTRKLRVGEIVFFKWNGFLWSSPILKINRKTVTVATSAGERRIDIRRVERP